MQLSEDRKVLLKVEKEDIVKGFFAIPNTVEHIGDSAFEGCNELIEVDIPNSVKVIGKRAFRNCIYLKEINIPDSVTTIHEKAFANCCEMRDSIIIPNSVTYIGDYAFSTCFRTLKFYLPDSLNEISTGMLYACENMKYVRMPSNVKRIKKHAFCDSMNLQEFVIPDSVIEFDEEVFFKHDVPRKLFVRSELALSKSFMYQFSDTNVQICLSDNNEDVMRLLQNEYPQLKFTVGETPTDVKYFHRIIENPEVIIYVDELSKAMEDIKKIKNNYDFAIVISYGEKEDNFNSLRSKVRDMFNYADVVMGDVDLSDVAEIDKDFDLFVLTKSEEPMKNIDILKRAKEKYLLPNVGLFGEALKSSGNWHSYQSCTYDSRLTNAKTSILDSVLKEAKQSGHY